MDKIVIITVGCKVNQAESEELALRLAEEGYRVTRDMEGAALCVVNTCAVTSEGEHKSRKAVSKAMRAGVPVIATGCSVRTDPGSHQAARGLQLVPNTDKDRLASIIAERGLKTGPGDMGNDVLRTRAVIKVQDGCDRGCAYCIVPRARGRSRSLPRDQIEAAVDRAVRRGAAELVLTGVNLGDYGRESGSSLSRLIHEMTARPDIGRVRLSSLEIDHVRGELLEEVACNPKVCKHLHLPLQSGDDRILEAMRRPYAAQEVMEVVSRLRQAVPEIAVTVDIMVGFPGEGEAEFSNTLRVIEELQPAKMHVFQYSPRPGTKAAGLAVQVDAAEKKERARRSRNLGLLLQQRFVKAQVGTRTEVAILEARYGEGAVGLTGNYVRVLLEPCKQELTAGLANVYIKGTRGCLALGDMDN